MTKKVSSDGLTGHGWAQRGFGFAPGLGEAMGQRTSGYGGVKCHANHKELSWGGGTILGASCNYPRAGYDIYIGFDSGMDLPQRYPWNDQEDSQVVHVKFTIPDMGIPSEVTEFKKMIVWTGEQLAAGKRIHCGCIGGHGRTGMFLAALHAHLTGEKDAIQHVRQVHCEKAVESEQQVKFLMKHYDVSLASAAKSYGHHTKPDKSWVPPTSSGYELSATKSVKALTSSSRAAPAGTVHTYRYVPNSRMNIWKSGAF